MKNTIIKTIKEINPETVILVQVGAFYHAYGKDSYILSYLCGYQIKSVENSYNTCGFPKAGLEKTLKFLTDNKISYIVTVKSLNYEVEKELRFKEENKYSEVYEKAYRYVNMKNRINSIYNYLIENINTPNIKSKIQKVEEVLLDNE